MIKFSTIFATLILIIATLPPAARAADITYTVSSAFLQDPSAIKLSGTITTDGVIGAVQLSDIVSYDIKAVFGTDTIEVTPSNTVVTADPTGVTATATTLKFDFAHTSTTGYANAYSLNFIHGYGDTFQICYQDAYGLCGGGSDLQVFNGGDSHTAYGVPVNDTIATVPSSAPEPATWAMMLMGAAGVGGALRRRRQAPLAA